MCRPFFVPIFAPPLPYLLMAEPRRDVIYFASDQHFGAYDPGLTQARERHFVRWLDHIRHDATELYLVGDLFDFWFEYKKVIPKGYPRLFGKLAELRDAGLPITLFAGNHDLWYKDYFPKYFDIPVMHGPIEREFFGKQYFIAHGDGRGPGDTGYKLMRKVFVNPVSKWAFGWLHPNLGVGLADWASRKSRQAHAPLDEIDHGDREMLYQYVKRKVEEGGDRYDYYVFGHRHLVKFRPVGERAHLVLLGDWLRYFSYLRVDADGPKLFSFKLEDNPVPQLLLQ